jgi:hypothetical protein
MREGSTIYEPNLNRKNREGRLGDAKVQSGNTNGMKANTRPPLGTVASSPTTGNPYTSIWPWSTSPGILAIALTSPHPRKSQYALAAPSWQPHHYRSSLPSCRPRARPSQVVLATPSRTSKLLRRPHSTSATQPHGDLITSAECRTTSLIPSSLTVMR